MLKIMIAEPGKEPYIKEVEGELSDLQEIVGGYIEAVTLPNDLIVICNEDGKFTDLPYNRKFGHDYLVGTFFITKSDEEGEFVSLSDEDIETAKSIITDDEVIID